MIAEQNMALWQQSMLQFDQLSNIMHSASEQIPAAQLRRNEGQALQIQTNCRPQFQYEQPTDATDSPIEPETPEFDKVIQLPIMEPECQMIGQDFVVSLPSLDAVTRYHWLELRHRGRTVYVEDAEKVSDQSTDQSTIEEETTEAQRNTILAQKRNSRRVKKLSALLPGIKELDEQYDAKSPCSFSDGGWESNFQIQEDLPKELHLLFEGDLYQKESSIKDLKVMQNHGRDTDLRTKFLKDQTIYEMVNDYSQDKALEGTKRKPLGQSLELLELTKYKIRYEKARIQQKRQLLSKN